MLPRSGKESTIASSALGDEAMVWTQATGVRTLSSMLQASGVDLTGWLLTNALDISGDGRTIVGQGIHNGSNVGYVAVIPEPTGLAAIGKRLDRADGVDQDIDERLSCLRRRSYCMPMVGHAPQLCRLRCMSAANVSAVRPISADGSGTTENCAGRRESPSLDEMVKLIVALPVARVTGAPPP